MVVLVVGDVNCSNILKGDADSYRNAVMTMVVWCRF